MNIDQLASEVLKLNSHDRAILAQTIWESLDPPYLAEDLSDDEAIALAKNRDSEMESGAVTPLSHSQLMGKLPNSR